MSDFDPMDCAFCCVRAGQRLPNGANPSCPLHGGPAPADPKPEVAAAFTAEAAQLDALADTLDAINRTDPSPDVAGEVRAYRIVAKRLRNKANPTTEDSR